MVIRAPTVPGFVWGNLRISPALVLAAVLLSVGYQGGPPSPPDDSPSRMASSDIGPATPIALPFGMETVGLVVKPGNQTIPDLEGRFLAWQDDSGAVSQVYLLDLATMVEAQAWPSPVAQSYPRLRDGLLSFVERQTFDHWRCSDWCTLLVWPESGTARRIQADSLDMAVTTDAYIVQTGGLVMPGGTERIYGRLLSNGSRELELRGGNPYENWPAASTDWAALSIRPYSDGRGSYYCPSSGDKWLDPCVTELGVVFPENRTTVVLTDSRSQYYKTEAGEWKEQCLRDFTREEFPSAFGSTVYWQDNGNSNFTFDSVRCTWADEQWDIRAFDLTGGGEVAIRTAPWNETRPDADEDFLVWADDRNGNWDIYAQDRDTGVEIRVTDDSRTQRNPTVSHGCVAWEDGRNGDWDVYGRCLVEPNWESARNVTRQDGLEFGRRLRFRENRTVTRNGTSGVGVDSTDGPPIVGLRGGPIASTPVETSRALTAECTQPSVIKPERRVARLPPP